MSVPLKDICELIVDCPHSTAPDEGEGYPLIRTPNIGPGFLDFTDVHRVSKEVFDKRNVRAAPRPMDLILAREAPAGNVGIVPEGYEVCLGQRTVLIRPDQSKVNPCFLNYYLNAPRQRHRLLSNANGATVSHVNMPIIRNLPVDLPERRKQEKIAGVLEAYDKLIENNRKQIALLEEAAQRLYKEWFVDLHFPNYESSRIVDGVPEGWKHEKIHDLISFYSNGGWGKESATGNSSIAAFVIRGTDIPDIYVGNYSSCPLRFHTEKQFKKRRLRAGDIVIELSNGNLANVGRSIVINQAMLDNLNDQAICASFCKLVRPIGAKASLLLSLHIKYLQHSGLLDVFKRRGSNGINNFDFNQFAALDIVVPPDELLNIFSLMYEMISNAAILINKSSEARNRLLSKFFSDEIEV